MDRLARESDRTHWATWNITAFTSLMVLVIPSSIFHRVVRYTVRQGLGVTVVGALAEVPEANPIKVGKRRYIPFTLWFLHSICQRVCNDRVKSKTVCVNRPVLGRNVACK